MASRTKAPQSPANDLVPRSMLPDRSVIPAGREFGAGAPAPKPRVPPTVKKKRTGGHIKKVKKYQAGGISMGPAANPNAPVQGGFGTPYMPSVPMQPRKLGGTPGLTPPTVPVQPRQPMGRARPMPVPMPVRRRGMNEGGAVKKYAAGGSISSASRRADGCAKKGKTKGRMV